MIDLFFPQLPQRGPKGRVVRVMQEPPQLTPRQLANRKYRQSAKGKAAAARTLAISRAKPEWRAKNITRTARWRADPVNRLHKNVLRRVQRRRQKNERGGGEHA